MKNLIYEQIKTITENEKDLIANLSNISACLNENLTDINWVGFYLMKEGELVLGPFQGKVACIRIPIGKGVCGSAVSERKILRIDDVHQFKGHIACDSASNSEIVLPIYKHDEIVAVLDIDSPSFNRFSEEDEKILNEITDYISKLF
ncbi:GAF domain-containing protein [Traorella massiliensis]|uniref:GAF domain-containing protein n=1 Tax=Traorella massiliensis TaxID=1903263 RepID=UPI00248DE073|nr:GAF domain-containing protein [Traorella massiliensis]